jgi:mTERF domain-containing protein
VRAEITDDGMEENENDDEDRELNFRRELWNVGPGSISSFNFSPYANDSVTIQKLVQLGVKIYKWERKYGIPEFILKLDFQRDIEHYLRFLVDVGVEPDNLGYHVTLNPHLLKESIENLNIRLDYLKSKNFSVEEIAQIINANPFWLSFSTRRIDRRLGYFQRTFELGGQQVRSLACKCPRLVTSNLGRTKDVTFKIKDCMGFEPKEIVTILLAHPEIWRIHPTKLWQRFDYLHNELKFSHEDLMHSPKLLLTALTTLGERVGFLQKLGRAQFNPEKPNFVSADNLIEGDDADFVVRIAKSSVVEFNEYLKTL